MPTETNTGATGVPSTHPTATVKPAGTNPAAAPRRPVVQVDTTPPTQEEILAALSTDGEDGTRALDAMVNQMVESGNFSAETIGMMAQNAMAGQPEAIQSGFQRFVSGATGIFSRITGRFLKSDGMSTFQKMVMQSGLDMAERNLANFLRQIFWESIDKYMPGKTTWMYRWVLGNRLGKAVVMSTVCIGLSQLLLTRVDVFEANGQMTHAKACIALSRILSRMVTEEVGNAINFDKLCTDVTEKAIQYIRDKGGDLDAVVNGISDADVHTVAAEARDNTQKMKERKTA